MAGGPTSSSRARVGPLHPSLDVHRGHQDAGQGQRVQGGDQGADVLVQRPRPPVRHHLPPTRVRRHHQPAGETRGPSLPASLDPRRPVCRAPHARPPPPASGECPPRPGGHPPPAPPPPELAQPSRSDNGSVAARAGGGVEVHHVQHLEPQGTPAPRHVHRVRKSHALLGSEPPTSWTQLPWRRSIAGNTLMVAPPRAPRPGTAGRPGRSSPGGTARPPSRRPHHRGKADTLVLAHRAHGSRCPSTRTGSCGRNRPWSVPRARGVRPRLPPGSSPCAARGGARKPHHPARKYAEPLPGPLLARGQEQLHPQADAQAGQAVPQGAPGPVRTHRRQALAAGEGAHTGKDQRACAPDSGVRPFPRPRLRHSSRAPARGSGGCPPRCRAGSAS